jgi:DNA repair photolyase
VNPYRGCFHGCAYCYARPTHQYLDFGAGTDFERQIVVKTNAPELLRESFQKKKWRGELVTFSGNTDCYQPLEATYQITRGCLEVCADFRNPVAIVTKGALVRRDVEVLQRLQRDAFVFVWVSIPWADDDMGHTIEPGCTIASQRFKTLRTLADAGIDCGVAVAPIIPGLNDSQIPEILERAAACGASRAFHILLRLPAEVKDVFVARLREAYPDRADKVLNALTEMRGGRLNDPEFGSRMRGEGPRWQAIRSLFQTHCRRLGLNPRRPAVQETTFQRPGEQLGLW